MKIFNEDSLDINMTKTRTRCVFIILASMIYGRNFIPLIKQECKDSGYPFIDNEDFDYLSKYAKMHGKDLIISTIKKFNYYEQLLRTAKGIIFHATDINENIHEKISLLHLLRLKEVIKELETLDE